MDACSFCLVRLEKNGIELAVAPETLKLNWYVIQTQVVTTISLMDP